MQASKQALTVYPTSKQVVDSPPQPAPIVWILQRRGKPIRVTEQGPIEHGQQRGSTSTYRAVAVFLDADSARAYPLRQGALPVAVSLDVEHIGTYCARWQPEGRMLVLSAIATQITQGASDDRN